MPVRDFTIGVASADIDDLRARLTATRWPAGTRSDWAEGTEPGYLRRLVETWARDFDWNAEQAALNRLRQIEFTAAEGTVIHAIHARGAGARPLPLIMTHGWPSSLIEWRHVVGPLTDPAAHGGHPGDAFDVVAPCLPGFGFSARRPGTPHTIEDTARLWAELMRELGYRRFAAQGCDWGAQVTAHLGRLFPDRVAAIHLGVLPVAPAADEPPTAFDRRTARWRAAEYGYAAIQGTKPQSLAYALADSPTGLAAWIAEKWRSWSDCAGEPESAIAVSDLLATVSLFWFTHSIGTASRIYAANPPELLTIAAGLRVIPPAGFCFQRSRDDDDPRSFLAVPRPGAPPRARAERVFDVHRWTELDHGGHFPALEVPQTFVEELRAFFRPFRS